MLFFAVIEKIQMRTLYISTSDDGPCECKGENEFERCSESSRSERRSIERAVDEGQVAGTPSGNRQPNPICGMGALHHPSLTETAEVPNGWGEGVLDRESVHGSLRHPRRGLGLSKQNPVVHQSPFTLCLICPGHILDSRSVLE